jgi:hypothetical protein
VLEYPSPKSKILTTPALLLLKKLGAQLAFLAPIFAFAKIPRESRILW